MEFEKLGPYTNHQQMGLVTRCVRYAVAAVERLGTIGIGVIAADMNANPLVELEATGLFVVDPLVPLGYELDVNVLPIAWMFGAVMQDSPEEVGLIGVVQVGLAAEIPAAELSNRPPSISESLMDDPRANESIIVIVSCRDNGSVLTRTFYAGFDRSTDPEDATIMLHGEEDGRPFLHVGMTQPSEKSRTLTEADSSAYAFWEGYNGEALKQQAPKRV